MISLVSGPAAARRFDKILKRGCGLSESHSGSIRNASRVLLAVLVHPIVHNAHDKEERGFLNPAQPGHFVRRGLRFEKVLCLERDAARVEQVLMLSAPDARSDRDSLLSILYDEVEVRVLLSQLDRDVANTAADIDDNRIGREPVPREDCSKLMRSRWYEQA